MLGQHQPIVAEVPLTAHQEAKPTAVTEASAAMGLLADQWVHDLKRPNAANSHTHRVK